MVPSSAYATVSCTIGRRHALAFHEADPPSPPQPRLLDRVRAAAHLRHYRRRTEAAYIARIRGYIVLHGKRHPTSSTSTCSLDGVVRAKRPERRPVVLIRGEVAAVLRPLTGAPRLMSSLLYGSGRATGFQPTALGRS